MENKIKTLYELLGRELKKGEKTAVERTLHTTSDFIANNHFLKDVIKVQHHRIDARLLIRDPQKIRDNYRHHIDYLNDRYRKIGGTAIYNGLITYPELLGITPTTIEGNVELLLDELDIQTIQWLLMGTTPGIKREKMELLLIKHFNYGQAFREDTQEYKNALTENMREFVRHHPEVLILSKEGISAKELTYRKQKFPVKDYRATLEIDARKLGYLN
ncbi:hypothetical protein J4476_00940 [Candidatus Woesearchaeota archaeon]|nr:MAG: hypothetical protein QT09_C0001G0063 [archaeon GW2011_AR18]MBS3161244.1 hypothetical protein [Candidatus Woesearchaeota archaeon]HIH25198.1 hypothetical protein [Nanoarchaeota archaeon]